MPRELKAFFVAGSFGKSFRAFGYCSPNTFLSLHPNLKWGVSEIHVLSVIASKKGLSELLKYHPDVHITIGHIDEKLNDEGDLVPGLGDAGDRLFGTPMIDDEEELVHPSKRKRSGSLASEASSNHR